MNHFHAQEKDRENWQKSMEKRKDLVIEIKRRNIKTHIPPHEMKIKDLEKLLLEG